MSALPHPRRPERPRGSEQLSLALGRRPERALPPLLRGGKGRGRRRRPRDWSPLGPAEERAGGGPGPAGSGDQARAGAARGGGEEATRMGGEGAARRGAGGEGARRPGRQGAPGSQPVPSGRRLPPVPTPLAASPAPGAGPLPAGHTGAAWGRASLRGLALRPRRAPRAWARSSRAAPRLPRPAASRPPPAGRPGGRCSHQDPGSAAPRLGSGREGPPRAGRELLKRHARRPVLSASAERGDVLRWRGWRRPSPAGLR